MFLRKLGKRGVAMTEYAILLAFVAAIGGSFASDNGLAASVTDAIGKAKDAINLVMSDKKNLLNKGIDQSLLSPLTFEDDEFEPDTLFRTDENIEFNKRLTSVSKRLDKDGKPEFWRAAVLVPRYDQDL